MVWLSTGQAPSRCSDRGSMPSSGGDSTARAQGQLGVVGVVVGVIVVGPELQGWIAPLAVTCVWCAVAERRLGVHGDVDADHVLDDAWLRHLRSRQPVHLGQAEGGARNSLVLQVIEVLILLVRAALDPE